MPPCAPRHSAVPVARAGDLEVRLATKADEVDAAQALRYRIFYEEMSAKPSPEMRKRQRDFDRYDPLWEHLLVLDHGSGGSVIGTYRLHRCGAETPSNELYTNTEYDLAPLLEQTGVLVELGRMCIHPSYRNGATAQLLWRGIAHYVFHHDVQLMFGCASLSGTDPDELALPLSYLHHAHLAPPDLRPRALENLRVPMDRLAPDAFTSRDGLKALPGLVKGYIRLGGFVGDGAVIDWQFGTVDVCMVVKTELVSKRYRQHYEREAGVSEYN